MRFPWRKRADSPVALSADRRGPSFSLTAPELIAQWVTGGDYVQPVSRAQALSVPAVKRGRDLVAGTIGGLDVNAMHKRTREQVPSALLEQPEPDFARSVTMTKTIEDMLLHQRAWWRVLELDPKTGYPSKIRRLDPSTVLVRENARVYVARDGNVQGQALEQIPDAELIRIESPNDGILVVGARAIRQALALDKMAARIAASPRPQGVFTPADGVADPGNRDEIAEMLDDWNASRDMESWGYVGAALKLNMLSWTAEELQLAESRQHAVLELARLMGVDPEDLGVSTTSRTYQNGEERRLALIDFTLSAYVHAIQDRLSMNDVLPPNHIVRFDFTSFTRADTKTRMETYAIGRQVGAYDDERIAELEQLPLSRVKKPEPAPVVAPPAIADPAQPTTPQEAVDA